MINFGRVRGFFINNNNFRLNPDVATVLAQIACYENVLPQGSPCSPVISNLIGHILDIRLASHSNRLGCSYSRYADDLTFSTNKRNFPNELAIQSEEIPHQWRVSEKLKKIIEKQGFVLNEAKTRMQYKNSRQEVTGLIVNSKINPRIEYRHTTRAMVHRLLNTGSYQKKVYKRDEDGNLITEEVDGTLEQLNGMLSFINLINQSNNQKKTKNSRKTKRKNEVEGLNSNEKVYQKFLFYKYFHALSKPFIICEGKTDNIYLECAIKRLIDAHPILAKKKSDGKIALEVSFLKRTATTGRILGLAGGAGEIKDFITFFREESKHIKTPGKKSPVIILIDNDDGSKKIYPYIQNLTKLEIDKSAPFHHILENLYIVATPLTHDGKDTKIEDFFHEDLKSTKLNKKTFNPSNSGFNSKTEYGKYIFAMQVVKKNQDTIDFSNFIPILERIEAVIEDYNKKLS